MCCPLVFVNAKEGLSEHWAHAIAEVSASFSHVDGVLGEAHAGEGGLDACSYRGTQIETDGVLLQLAFLVPKSCETDALIIAFALDNPTHSPFDRAWYPSCVMDGIL